MRTYFPTLGLLATIVAGGCAGGSATDTFGDGGLGGEGGGGEKDGTAGNDAHITLADGAGSSGSGSGSQSGSSGSGTSSSSSGTGSSSGSSDGGMQQTCVHNSDCTGPNICAGNNGQACLGGFCVATNMPMSCDDGVPCTTVTDFGGTYEEYLERSGRDYMRK